MLSLAALCSMKGWRFEYTSKALPARLKQRPSGNYKAALELGMVPNEVLATEYEAVVERLRHTPSDARTLMIPQGGAARDAGEGIAKLADEISAWQAENSMEGLTVVTPSGTGTTAAFLARHLPACRVLTTPSVGDSDYLKKQIAMLMCIPPNLVILEGRKRYRFGSLHSELFDYYRALKDAGIEFDLLYAPVMWRVLLENIEKVNTPVLYVHSGGVSGNETMLARYARQQGDWH